MLPKAVIPLLLLYGDRRRAILGRTRFQKFVFLAQVFDEKLESRYIFIPYKHGPFSPELQRDIDELIEDELINEHPEEFDNEKVRYRYSLTEMGREIIEEILSGNDLSPGQKSISATLEKIKKKYKDFSLEKLIEDIYENYPGYAVYAR